MDIETGKRYSLFIKSPVTIKGDPKVYVLDYGTGKKVPILVEQRIFN